MQTLFALLMFISSVFLILLVLVQRGRGGGLSGAFGGMGGQSAFGAKAGDTFTRVTIVAATVWIVLCMLATGLLSGDKKDQSILTQGGDSNVESIADDLKAAAPPVGDLDASGVSTETPADVDAAAEDATAPAADASVPASDEATAEVSTEATDPAGE